MNYTSMSQKGQVVVPKIIRDKLEIQPNDKLHIKIVDGDIVMSPIPNIGSIAGVFSPHLEKSTFFVLFWLFDAPHGPGSTIGKL